ncbi:TPA: small ubiquitin-related modifier 2 precursor, partial [Bos taurus]
KEAG